MGGSPTYTPQETRDNHTPARATQSQRWTVHDMTQRTHTRHASLSTSRRGEGALSACTRHCGETDVAAAGAGLPDPRRNARMLRLASGSGPEQEPRPKARIPARATRRGRRRRGALRLRRRRGVAYLGRCLAIERLDGETTLAGRGRRGSAGGHVAHRERGHHGAPKTNVEQHHVQHAS